MCEKSELNRITEAIASAARRMFNDKLESVILYGSYARGDYDSDSDIDIMIIVSLSQSELIAYRSEIYQLSSDLSLSTDDCTTISISLNDKATFDKYKEALPFYSNVLKDGIKIYAA